MLPFAQVLIHPYNHVQVVGHDTKLPYLQLRIKVVNLMNFLMLNSSSEL